MASSSRTRSPTGLPEPTTPPDDIVSVFQLERMHINRKGTPRVLSSRAARLRDSMMTYSEKKVVGGIGTDEKETLLKKRKVTHEKNKNKYVKPLKQMAEGLLQIVVGSQQLMDVEGLNEVVKYDEELVTYKNQFAIGGWMLVIYSVFLVMGAMFIYNELQKLLKYFYADEDEMDKKDDGDRKLQIKKRNKKQVSEKELKTFRSVLVQSPVVYTWWTAQPRFKFLMQDRDHGAWVYNV